MTDSKFLKSFSVFSDLTLSEIEQFIAGARLLRYEKGEVIIHEKDEGNSMFVLLKGEVEVIKTLTLPMAGEENNVEGEKVLSRFRAEQHLIFGEVGLLEEEYRTATIRARSQCELLEISKNHFFLFAESHPELGFKIIRRISSNLCTYLRKANNDIIKLTTALSLALSR